MLNSLQMGFKTLAIQKRSSEVWEILANVKKEFSAFGNVLEKAQKKIKEADNEIEKMVPDFVYNPEFLREKHAETDFINADLIVFGGKLKSVHRISEFYLNYTKCINTNYVSTDPHAASLIKYTINSFLATKTIFFNEMHDLFAKTPTNEKWEDFIKFLSIDKRIGDSHMMVPGHDGRYGFGGACLPKDSAAIIKYAESLNINLKTIKSVVKTNNKIRAKYNSKTNREDVQNIKYNIFEEE